jgi:hypothetical protein
MPLADVDEIEDDASHLDRDLLLILFIYFQRKVKR